MQSKKKEEMACVFINKYQENKLSIKSPDKYVSYNIVFYLSWRYFFLWMSI